mmetsp:Transcript_42652/g.135505  ORF Transcript_42652/g.135505 Transcript_42652/m.135505 type:complete len:341 (-) Transcript_42652:1281-2303(-)
MAGPLLPGLGMGAREEEPGTVGGFGGSADEGAKADFGVGRGLLTTRSAPRRLPMASLAVSGADRRPLPESFRTSAAGWLGFSQALNGPLPLLCCFVWCQGLGASQSFFSETRGASLPLTAPASSYLPLPSRLPLPLPFGRIGRPLPQSLRWRMPGLSSLVLPCSPPLEPFPSASLPPLASGCLVHAAKPSLPPPFSASSFPWPLASLPLQASASLPTLRSGLLALRSASLPPLPPLPFQLFPWGRGRRVLSVLGAPEEGSGTLSRADSSPASMRRTRSRLASSTTLTKMTSVVAWSWIGARYLLPLFSAILRLSLSKAMTSGRSLQPRLFGLKGTPRYTR